MENVAIIGTGVMGLTAACKIAGAGHPLAVYDVSPKAAESARRLGATLVRSPAEAAKRSDIILLFLPGPEEITDCLIAEDGLLSASKAGSIIADMSTSDPQTSSQLAGQAAKKGVGYVDAPVLGRPDTVGKWALPVGGRQEDVDTCRPVFQILATNVFHVGPCGSGHKIKLLNQLMFGAINAMTAEMMAIAQKVGIAPGQLFQIIISSQAGTVSNLFKELGKRVSQNDYDDPVFTVDLLVKDIKLAVHMAQKNNAPPIVARAVELINEMSQAQGMGDKDTSIMWKCFKGVWEA